MSKSKPVRQDFVAKVRYINNLPPPPINPKFIKPQTTESLSPEEEADQILSSLFRKDNFKKLIENLDEENGMPLNLINNAGVLDKNDLSSICKQNKQEPVELHPSDRALLRDAGIGKITRKEPEVSFLRRTEYIAEKSASKSTGDLEKNGKQEEEKFDPDSQLKAVEKTFELAQESLANFSKLRHPTKKHLKPVNAWQLLPDTSMMDAKFLAIKFNGSAAFSRELQALKRQQGESYDDSLQKQILSTAIFKPITSNDGEWMSLYEDKNAKEVEELHSSLNSEEPNKPSNLTKDPLQYQFSFVRNYDMNFLKHSKPFEELSVKFVEGESKKRKLAYYYPITGKIDLKKYRASTNTQVNNFVKESTYDAINYRLREPNADEMRKMDNIRSEFDPMEYEGEEEVEAPDAVPNGEKKEKEESE